MPRLYTDVLRDMDAGNTVNRLTEKLAEVVMAVGKTNKKGSITLTLDIVPNGELAVSIVDTIKVKVPEEVRGRSNFFVTQDGDLTRRDPRQTEMFRAADTERELQQERTASQPPRRVEPAPIRREAAEPERRVAAE